MGLEKKGFTLIEFLVVMGIMATVGTMVVNLFLSNLRTAAKTKALTEVKQNGDYALAVMERMIHNAKEVTSYSATSIEIVNLDEGTTTFDCSGTQIASTSGVTTGYLTSAGLEVESGSFTYQQPVGKPLVVTINFTLRKGTASLGREFFAEIPFQTTVSTRLY